MIHWKFAAFIFCCAFLSGCETQPPIPEKNVDPRLVGVTTGAIAGGILAGIKGGKPLAGKAVGSPIAANETGIEEHYWAPLSIPTSQRWSGYRPKYFSYVLSGNVGGVQYLGQNDQIIAARRNLEGLVSEVKGLRDLRELAEQGIKEKTFPSLKKANIFLIPALISSDSVADFGYSYEIAAGYRNKLVSQLPANHEISRALRGYGPFIVATRGPVNDLTRVEGSSESELRMDLLILDLGGVPAKAIPVYLNVFKQAIEMEGIYGAVSITSLRAAIVSFLLNMNENVPVIAAATLSIPAAAKGIGSKP